MPVSAQRQLESLDAEAIWQDLHARLLGFIARRVADRNSAEDILQDVMVRIHRHAAELEHAPAVGAWVHQIARNAIADHYRRASVRRERPAGIDLDRGEQPVLEDPSTEPRSELAECLAPLLKRLLPLHASGTPLHSRRRRRGTRRGTRAVHRSSCDGRCARARRRSPR